MSPNLKSVTARFLMAGIAATFAVRSIMEALVRPPVARSSSTGVALPPSAIMLNQIDTAECALYYKTIRNSPRSKWARSMPTYVAAATRG